MSVSVSLLLAFSATLSLQKAMNSSATWTMERRLAGSTRSLRSSGDVRCRMGEGIVWRVLAPFVSSVEMTTNAMVFVDEDGRREKTLDELPHYEDIRRATDAFVAGQNTAFDAVFEVTETSLAAGGWRLELVPKDSGMRRLAASVEITGAELPTNVVLRTSDGGESVIRFREFPRVP